MTHAMDDIVKLAAGTLVEMELLKEDLEQAGIEGRVVGDDLDTGLGTALVGSVELWIHANDAERATKIMNESAERATKHRKHDHAKFPHPTSDPKPDRGQGPHHPPEPHRPSP